MRTKNLLFFPQAFFVLAVSLGPLWAYDYSQPFNAPVAKKIAKSPVYKPVKTIQAKKNTSSSLAWHATRLPPWPGFARFPEREDFLFTTMGADFASWAYDPEGNIKDASSLVVGPKEVTVGDVVLLARLFKAEAVEDEVPGLTASLLQQAHYFTGMYENSGQFEGLVDKELVFDAQTRGLAWSLNYSRTFFHNICAVMLQLPLMLRINKIEMTRRLSPAENQKFNDLDGYFDAHVVGGDPRDNFFGKYPGGLSEFYEDLLSEKGMIAKPQHVRLGLGDVSVCLNYRLDSPNWDWGLIGVGVTMPTARAPDRRYLWPSETGGGGFWELRAHGGAYWREWRLFNPHIFIDGRFRFLTAVDRRAAEVIEGSSVPGNVSNKLSLEQPFIDKQYVFVKDLVEPESTIPAFAQDIERIEYRKGPELNIRLGNVMDDVFFDSAYFDVYYEFMLKVEDELGFERTYPGHMVSDVMKNTDRIGHTIGGSYLYQHNEEMRLELGGSHRFAGKNSLRVFEIHGAIQFNF